MSIVYDHYDNIRGFLTYSMTTNHYTPVPNALSHELFLQQNSGSLHSCVLEEWLWRKGLKCGGGIFCRTLSKSSFILQVSQELLTLALNKFSLYDLGAILHLSPLSDFY